MSIGDPEIGSSPSLPEKGVRSESRDNRRDVVNTLKSSIHDLELDINSLAPEDPNNPSEEYKKLSWIKESVTRAYEKTQGHGRNKSTFTNTFQEFQQGEDGQKIPTGREIKLQEGIPVDNLIEYLQKKSEKLDLRDPKQAKEKQRLINQAHLLQRNSKPFYEVPGRFHTPPTEDELSVIYSRKHQEANLISKDYRTTDNVVSDWFKGEDALDRRQELFLPKAAKNLSPTSKLVTPGSPTEPQPEANGGIPPDQDPYNVLEPEETKEEGEDKEEKTDTGIPIDQVLHDIEEPEEEEEIVVPTITATTPTVSVIPTTSTQTTVPTLTTPTLPTTAVPSTTTATANNTSVRERISLDVIRADDVVDKDATLKSRKDLHERMGRHAFWKFWRWPEKIGLRLSQGGIENIQQERLRRACITNNVSFASLDMMKNAATAANQTESDQHRKSILERFRLGRIVERENNTQPIIEARKTIEGELKTAIINDIIKPIIDSQITGSPQQQANEIRARLTTFVKGHLTDPQVRELFGAQASDYGYVAEYFATDLLEKSQAIKEQMDKHNESLDQISAYVDLHFGIARDQQNTDIRSLVDRKVADARRRQNERLARGIQETGRITGWILNPLTVGIATSLAVDGLARSVGWGGRAIGLAAPLAGALGGGVVAGARRYIELGGDLKMQNAELSMGEILPQRQQSRNRLRRMMERVAGLERRKDLLDYRYDSLTVNQLLAGTNGQEVAIPGDTNKPQNKRKLESVDNLLVNNLSDPANRLNAIERMTEIQTRINRGKRNRVDLITFSNQTQVNSDLNKLYDAVDKIKKSLEGKSGLDSTSLSNLERSEQDRWMDAFDRDKRQKDDGFRIYRLKQAGGASLFGATMGFTGALGSQWGAAEIARHFPQTSELPIIGGIFKPGRTEAEKLIHGAASTLGHPEIATGPASVDLFAEIYNTGGRVDINDHITAQANPDHSISLLDKTTGQPIPDQPQIIAEADGHLVATGSLDHLPGEIKNWSNQEIGLRSQISEAVASGQSTTIPVGNANIEINGSAVNVSVDNDTVHGNIGYDSVLHLSNDNVNTLKNTGGELLDNGFPDSKIIENPSILDQAKKAFNQPDLNPKTINIQGLGEATITPSSGEILIHPSTEILAGQEIHGIFNPDNGSLHFNLPPNSNLNLTEVQQLLEKTGFTGVNVENIPGKTITEDAIEHFRNLGSVENANREFWHDNDTPMRKLPDGRMIGADGKELQFYHNLLKGDTVDLDMSKMVSQIIPQGGLNWDSTIDSQYSHLVKDIIINPDGSRTYNNFEFLITPNDAADNAREIIKLIAGQDGHIQIPANTDLHQFFDTSSGKVEQLARFIEVAHVEPDGTRTIIATSVGKGITDISTTTPGIHSLEATLPNTHTYDLDLTPPQATEIIPPIIESPPFIPIPFAPRHPLEPLRENGIGTPFYYEMPINDERRRLFKQNLSPTLKANPQAILNPQREIQLYFDRQSPEYRQEVTNLAEQITVPASPNLKAIVCIPVAGHEEGTHIYETLENYSKQDAQKDQYEILLFVNHPEGTNLDKTVDEIKRFQHDHPEMPIRMIYKQLPMSQAKMAVIRKYLNDVALLRGSSSINQGKDLILISNDADLRGIAPEYVSNFIDKFDKDPKTDLMVGQLDWDPASYVEYPVIHAGTRLFQYLNLLVWNGRNGDRPSSGANTALRASIYAGVGGYQINDQPGAEDVILGQAIRVARDTNKTIGYAGTRVSRLYTSSRRAMDAWTAGFAPIEQWDKNWGAINGQIRQLKLGVHQTVDYDDPVVIESVKKDLEKVIKRTLNYYSGTDQNLETPLFKKAVWFLGLKYKINQDGDVEITEMNKFIKGIKRYQEYGVALQQIKSGKLPADALKNLVDEPDEDLLATTTAPTSTPGIPAPTPTPVATPRPGGPIQNLRTLPNQVAQTARQTATWVQRAVTNRAAPAPAIPTPTIPPRRRPGGSLHNPSGLPLTPDTMLASTISTPDIDISNDSFSDNVATRFEVLEQFANTTTVESREAYQKSLQEVMRLLEGKEGIVELQKDVPTVVLSDLHARRNFLVNALKEKINGESVYDLLKQGKINIVCLGDGMHSEQPLNWIPSKYETEKDINGKTIIKKDIKGQPIYTEYGRLSAEKEKILRKQFETNHNKYEPDVNIGYNSYHENRVANDLRSSKNPAFLEIEQKVNDSYGNELKILLDKEMTDSFGIMKMIMDLKVIAPNNFHYLKGNHDDILGGFQKYNSESKLIRWWTKNNYGEDFLQQWDRFEKLLPVLAKGPDFVLSHAAPFEAYTKADIAGRKESTIGTKTVVAEDGKHHHRGLTWTDNTEPDQMTHIAKAIPGTLKNLGLPDKTTWIIGHRPIDAGTNFRSQLRGQLIQINDPGRQLIAYLPIDRTFDPNVDVKSLTS